MLTRRACKILHRSTPSFKKRWKRNGRESVIPGRPSQADTPVRLAQLGGQNRKGPSVETRGSRKHFQAESRTRSSYVHFSRRRGRRLTAPGSLDAFTGTRRFCS